MDATSFFALVAVCAPLVHPQTAHALVSVESAFNPHAIGVVAGALQRQPTPDLQPLPMPTVPRLGPPAATSAPDPKPPARNPP